jgi:ferredoxin-fold anticodon binding domain-containing protein
MHDGDDEIVLMFREHPDAKVKSEIASVYRLLRLDPNLRRFSVSAGICPTEGNEIKFETRSILMIMHALAMGVEVPSAHSAETIETAVEPVDESRSNLSLVKIFSGEKRPEDAYAEIQYRSHWFWIESHDVQSKRAFSFIQLLMNLSEGGTENRGPVLTLPTG